MSSLNSTKAGLHHRQDCRTLDARDLYCPEPVMMLHNAIRTMAVGERVKVLATDPSTQRDIPKFCQFLGHVLLESGIEEQETAGQVFVYIVCKAER
jgi:tRNA 2-thiouridine synthesizing protein A